MQLCHRRREGGVGVYYRVAFGEVVVERSVNVEIYRWRFRAFELVSAKVGDADVFGDSSA